jgi:Na+/proline symporter
LVVFVLQKYVFDALHVPFAATVLISLGLIFAYTYKGGLKTIIITDTLQTFFLISSVFLTIYFICQSLNLRKFKNLKILIKIPKSSSNQQKLDKIIVDLVWVR